MLSTQLTQLSCEASLSLFGMAWHLEWLPVYACLVYQCIEKGPDVDNGKVRLRVNGRDVGVVTTTLPFAHLFPFFSGLEYNQASLYPKGPVTFAVKYDSALALYVFG